MLAHAFNPRSWEAVRQIDLCTSMADTVSSRPARRDLVSKNKNNVLCTRVCACRGEKV